MSVSRSLLIWIIILLNLCTYTSSTIKLALEDWPKSTVEKKTGHYPAPYTVVSSVVFEPNGVFYLDNKGFSSVDNKFTTAVWDLEHRDHSQGVTCDKHYDTGYVFTIFYWLTSSNYFHLHYDMMIPLYQQVYHGNSDSNHGNIAFMPTVETSRLKKLNWDTDAFSYLDKFWMETTKFISGNHDLLPLNRSFLDRNETICFRKVYFGTPGWKRDASTLVQGFIRHVKHQLNITDSPFTQHRVGIIARYSRRKILNEEELVSSVQELAPTDVVDFSGKSYKQQVSLMQKYTVLVGMNGAGLMNGLYLPPHAVCIQMVPYQAQLNFVEYGKLMKSRGPYLEWHNKHEDLHRAHDNNNNNPDTIVSVDEFRALIKDAIALVDSAWKKIQRQEL